MANYQLATAFRPLTAMVARSGQEPPAVGYSAVNSSPIGDPFTSEHPMLSAFRSLDVVFPQILYYDMGASVAFDGISVLGANVTPLELAWSTDDISYTPFPGDPYAVAQDPYSQFRTTLATTQIRRLWAANAQTGRYIRLTCPSGASVDNSQGFWEVPLILAPYNLATLGAAAVGENVQAPLAYSLTEQVQEVGRSIATVGPAMRREPWTVLNTKANATTLQVLQQAPRHKPIMVFRNNGNIAEVYLYRRTRDIQWEEQPGSLLDVQLTLQEMM